MDTIASQITSLTIVYSTVYSDADQRKYQSSASLAIVREIHRRPVNSPHKWSVTRKMLPFDDVIMNMPMAPDKISFPFYNRKRHYFIVIDLTQWYKDEMSWNVFISSCFLEYNYARIVRPQHQNITLLNDYISIHCIMYVYIFTNIDVCILFFPQVFIVFQACLCFNPLYDRSTTGSLSRVLRRRMSTHDDAGLISSLRLS